jgi:hypothetical protein
MTRPGHAVGTLALVAATFLAVAPAITTSRGEPLVAGTQRQPGAHVTAGKTSTVWPARLRPHALKLLINGRRWPLTPLNGGDDYSDIRAGRLRVEARWLTDARGTGYHVAVSTTEPFNRVYRRCFTGTSCLVVGKLRIRVNQEMSVTVRVLRTGSNKLVEGFKACLDGRQA